MHTEPITAAVTYWSDFLSSNDAPPRDNGDSASSALAILLGMMAETHKPTDTIKVNDFKAALTRRLETALASDYPRATLSVDYNPEGMLWDALREANIDSARDAGPLPWKTVMWVTPESVTVRQGYGAESRVLWTRAVSPTE